MDNICNWPFLNTPVELSAEDVHVWCVDLTTLAPKTDQFFSLLNQDEQQRANRFQFPNDRNRFIIARGVLRKLLSQYVKIPPERLQFHYNKYGKPYLEAVQPLQFNLSHAHTKALYAVSLTQPLGVDIEYSKKDLAFDSIAERFFSANESRIIKNLTDVQKSQAFFTGWVRKEAYLKALGMGLNYSLANIEVSLLPGQSAQILAIHDKQQTVSEWVLYTLAPFKDYEAALVVHGKPLVLKTWAWQDKE